MAAIAAGVGLIHGFGFASFLSESLAPGTPAFAPALAGFNIGLEIGQVALVALTEAVFALLGRVGPRVASTARVGVLEGAAAVSGSWLVERVAVIPALL